jgi:anti-anti-sigma regulatory factor
MAMIATWLNIAENCVVQALQQAAEKLDCANGEVVLDFVSVRRIDSNALRAMEGFASQAEKKAVKVVLRGVNVDVYKVLKLVKLAPRFSFLSCDGDLGPVKLESSHAQPSTK